jgi:hypothetical protein
LQRRTTELWIAVEAYRQSQASSTSVSVPTALERTGDFSPGKARPIARLQSNLF